MKSNISCGGCVFAVNSYSGNSSHQSRQGVGAVSHNGTIVERQKHIGTLEKFSGKLEYSPGYRREIVLEAK